MKTEQKLLIALVGNTSHEETSSLLAENIDWQLFLQTAEAHRVIPSIFKRLRSFFKQLPPEISGNLQIYAENWALANLNFNAQLVKLSELFASHGIEFLCYKGATLAQLAYGDPSLRQFGDLDILIRKKDFPQIKNLILENGGRSAWNLSAKQEKAVLKYYYEFPFRFGTKPVLVEIHWAFMESFFAFDYQPGPVFRRSQIVEVNRKKIPTFSNEDLLLYLCVHGSKHFWKRLGWICDIGRLIEAQSIQWNMATGLAKEYGCRRMLNLGLLLAKDLIKINLPDEIQSQINNDKVIKSLADELKNQLFDDRFSAESLRTDIHLKMRERWRDKFTYSHRLFTTKLIDSLFMPMGRPQ